MFLNKNCSFFLRSEESQETESFLEWQPCHSSAEGFDFYQNYHIIISLSYSLAVYLPIFYFSFYQKTNLHLYEGARLTLLYTLPSAIPRNVIIAYLY